MVICGTKKNILVLEGHESHAFVLKAFSQYSKNIKYLGHAVNTVMCQDLKGHELRNQNVLDLLTYKGVFALGVYFDKKKLTRVLF